MMTYPLVRDPAAEGMPVRLTEGFSTIPLRRNGPDGLAVSQRDLEDAHLINALIDA